MSKIFIIFVPLIYASFFGFIFNVICSYLNDKEYFYVGCGIAILIGATLIFCFYVLKGLNGGVVG